MVNRRGYGRSGRIYERKVHRHGNDLFGVLGSCRKGSRQGGRSALRFRQFADGHNVCRVRRERYGRGQNSCRRCRGGLRSLSRRERSGGRRESAQRERAGERRRAGAGSRGGDSRHACAPGRIADFHGVAHVCGNGTHGRRAASVLSHGHGQRRVIRASSVAALPARRLCQPQVLFRRLQGVCSPGAEHGLACCGGVLGGAFIRHNSHIHNERCAGTGRYRRGGTPMRKPASAPRSRGRSAANAA